MKKTQNSKSKTIKEMKWQWGGKRAQEVQISLGGKKKKTVNRIIKHLGMNGIYQKKVLEFFFDWKVKVRYSIQAVKKEGKAVLN